MPLKPLDRRMFLRATGVAIGLPFLDAMLPRSAAQAKKMLTTPKRMVLVGRPLGLYTPYFFPDQAGKDYEPSRYLKILQGHREQFTVISGMSHRYASGHFAEVGLFTGVHPDHIRPSEIRNGISLDQEAAAHVGKETRFPSLVIGGGDVAWNSGAYGFRRNHVQRRYSSNSLFAAPRTKKRSKCAESVRDKAFWTMSASR